MKESKGEDFYWSYGGEKLHNYISKNLYSAKRSRTILVEQIGYNIKKQKQIYTYQRKNIFTP